MTIFEIVRELIEHSTLGGSHKARLHWHLDGADPAATQAGPEPELAPETPEQELARLRAENEALKQQGATAEDEQVSRETPVPSFLGPGTVQFREGGM